MERVEEIKNEIHEHEEAIEELKFEYERIKDKERHLYIGMFVIGDYDYWDEYYCCLGKITEEQAAAWLEQVSNEHMEDQEFIKIVPEETYNYYRDWLTIEEDISNLNNIHYHGSKYKDDEIESTVIELINIMESKREKLVQDLGIGFPSFMHPHKNPFDWWDEEEKKWKS